MPNSFIVSWRINIYETEASLPAAIHSKWLSCKRGATCHLWPYVINKERLHSKRMLSINQFPYTLMGRLLAAVSAICSTTLQLSKKYDVTTHVGTVFSQMFDTCAWFFNIFMRRQSCLNHEEHKYEKNESCAYHVYVLHIAQRVYQQLSENFAMNTNENRHLRIISTIPRPDVQHTCMSSYVFMQMQSRVIQYD
jgi:hypothetical protein